MEHFWNCVDGDVSAADLAALSHRLAEQIGRACTIAKKPFLQQAAEQVLAKLPEIQRLIQIDVETALAKDPAADCEAEVVHAYPSVIALFYYRVAHHLLQLGVPVLPRVIATGALKQTGIDIHPGAKIGEGCFIDHGVGVVIGQTAIIGRNVTIFQGVTLGAKSFPMIEDDVTIYAGATILGRITIGKGAVIGGNVWVTESIAPGCKITQNKFHQDGYQGS
jgi:serine O-acetyltransferase